MSWSVGATADNLESDAREKFNAFLNNYNANEGEIEATKEQFEAALSAAKSIVDSGAVGSAKYVNLSGHANPGHTPRDGYANDILTISISQ